MAEDWLTTDKAAELTGYHPDTIRELLRGGQVIGRKWGRDWQVKRSSLLAYVQKVTKKGGKRGPKKRG